MQLRLESLAAWSCEWRWSVAWWPGCTRLGQRRGLWGQAGAASRLLAWLGQPLLGQLKGLMDFPTGAEL